MLRKAQDINLLQFQHFRKIAVMKLPKQQTQRQIETLYNYFKDLRIKQMFLNELKLYIQLKLIKEQEQKAIGIDFAQYKSLLIKKSLLIHKICIKKECTPVNKELFLRNELSIKPFESLLSNQAFNKPYEYPLQQLRKAFEQIVVQAASDEDRQIQLKIARKQKQNEQIIKRIQVMKKLVQQKSNRLQRLKQGASQSTQKPQKTTNTNIIPLEDKRATSIDRQQLIEKFKRPQQILSNRQCRQQTELSQKLVKIKQAKLKLKDKYSNLTQKYKALHFNVGKYLKKQTIVSLKRKQTSQYKKQEAELNNIKQKYLLIQEKKRMLRQKQVNL